MKVGKSKDSRPSAGASKQPPRLEVVLKCDSVGSMEGVTASLSKVGIPGAEIITVRSGIGTITQSDVLMAETAGRLIIGFQVKVVPGLERILRERHVEVRLYDTIYMLSEDISSIAQAMISRPAEEAVTGSGKVVALFKSTRKGIIIGCEVESGHLAVGQHFRIISAMGPVYSGIIESLHIDEQTVQKATPGQKVGIRIKNFNRAKVGDLVESYRPQSVGKARPWEPKGEIIRR